jgi:hypothetical protein
MSATQKIAVHSLSGKKLYTSQHRNLTNPPDLKNTTDDALPNYLHSLKFRQIHTQTDVRLALGYAAVTIAGALFWFDWKFGWDSSKPYTAPAVAAYFILNGAFSYWLWVVEKGVVYEGEGKTGKVRSTPIFYYYHHMVTSVRKSKANDYGAIGPNIHPHKKAHPHLQCRHHLLDTRFLSHANNPHPRAHDALVHCRRILHRETLPAMARVGSPCHWRRGPE